MGWRHWGEGGVGTFGVELLVHGGVVGLEPVGAFFGGAAEFAVLGWGISLWFLAGGSGLGVML